MKTSVLPVAAVLAVSFPILVFGLLTCGARAAEPDGPNQNSPTVPKRLVYPLAVIESPDEKSYNDEAEVLRQHLQMCENAYKMVHALYVIGAKGGDLDLEAELRYDCRLTKARLAEVQGKWDDARRELEAAISAANVLVEAASARYATDGDDRMGLDRVNASAKLTEARLMLVKVKKRLAEKRH